MMEKVKRYIEDHKMLRYGESVVVGVSGGSDSMCLLSILMNLREQFNLVLQVVHIHHGIRGKDADNDAAFVEKFCEKYGIMCKTFYFDVLSYAKESGLSSEEAGRILRYKTFSELADKMGGVIAVAHNACDNAETVMLNMFRGTGIKGISGIMPVRGNIIRPILCLTKEEIYEYLEKSGIDYRVDQSNFTTEYTRNKLRLKVIPYIEENINDRASAHINNLAEDMLDLCEYVDEVASNILKSDSEVINVEKYGEYNLQENKYIRLHKRLFDTKKIIVSEVIRKAVAMLADGLKDITRQHIEKIIELNHKNVGSTLNLPYNIVVIKEYEDIVLLRVDKEKTIESTKETEICEKVINAYGTYDLPLEQGTIKVFSTEERKIDLTENKYTKWISYDILKDSLFIRTRKPGDYIVVNSTGAKKKLKDYFIDEKIPQRDRDKVLLLANGQEIIWVIGYRMGENYKVNDKSKNIIGLEISMYHGGKNDERQN